MEDVFVIEADGSLYSCDHFVYPEHLLGNITENSLRKIADGEELARFGQSKSYLPKKCLNCRYLPACNGGCIKNRITKTESSAYINYLCSDYLDYFNFIDKYMRVMVQLYKRGIPVSDIMKVTNRSVWI